MTSSPQPLPSLPPSPAFEQPPALPRNDEDIAHVWHEDEDTIIDGKHLNPKARKRGGKGKERAVGSGSDEEDEDEEDEDAVAAGYPPTKEEEAESRRVQEVRATLRLIPRTIAPRHASLPCASGEARREPVSLLCFAFCALRAVSHILLNFAEPPPLGNRRTPEAEGRARVRVRSPYKSSRGLRQQCTLPPC